MAPNQAIICFTMLSLIRLKLVADMPKKFYNFLLGPIALLGFFIWAIPMNMGFYEFFRGIF